MPETADRTCPSSDGFAGGLHVDEAGYEEIYAASIADPESSGPNLPSSTV